MRISFLILLVVILSVVEGSFCFSQSVGINPTGTLPNQTAGLDIDFPNKGVLVPRMTAAVRLAIVNPANALLVFDTDSDCFFFYKLSNTSWNSLCGIGSAGNTILYADFTTVPNTSSTSWQTLKSWTIPGNTLMVNGEWIEIELFARANIPLNPVTFQIVINGVIVFTSMHYITTGQVQDFDCIVKLYRIGSAAEKSVAVGSTPDFLARTYFGNHSFNLASPITVDFRAQNVAGVANTIIAESLVIRKIQ